MRTPTTGVTRPNVFSISAYAPACVSPLSATNETLPPAPL